MGRLEVDGDLNFAPTRPDRKRHLHRLRFTIASAVNRDTPQLPRRRKLQWIFAAGAVLFVVALLVWPEFPRMRGRWSSALWNLLHVPAFFAITWGTATILPASLERVRRIFYAAAAALSLGTLTEMVQGLTGRSASWDDLLFDGVGIALAVTFLARQEPWSPRAGKVYAALVIAALFLCLSPAWGRDLLDGLRSLR
jgi:VanZ family protein